MVRPLRYSARRVMIHLPGRRKRGMCTTSPVRAPTTMSCVAASRASLDLPIYGATAQVLGEARNDPFARTSQEGDVHDVARSCTDDHVVRCGVQSQPRSEELWCDRSGTRRGA